jgi:hypothetical protein
MPTNNLVNRASSKLTTLVTPKIIALPLRKKILIGYVSGTAAVAGVKVVTVK